MSWLINLFKKEDIEQNRLNSIARLREYYLDNLAEDHIDGSDFDCDVLKALYNLERKYCLLQN